MQFLRGSASGAKEGSDHSTHSLLLPGVGEIVEVNLLAVPVDPGRDEAKAVEPGSFGPVALLEIHAEAMAVKAHRDLSAATRGGWRVLQRPGVRFPIRVDVRELLALAVAL